MCVINEGRKRPNLMSSIERVAQGIENSAKIIIAIKKNDQSTSLGNEVGFELPPAEVGFITKPTKKIRIGIGLSKVVLHSTM